MTATRPAVRREFVQTIASGYVHLTCRTCMAVKRFVRGDDHAIRDYKAGHVCASAGGAA